jgi:hypothetical protein
VKFKLTEQDGQGNKTGVHRIGAERYHAGDIIESDIPLDDLFRNKFERVPDNTPASKPEMVNVVGKVVQPPIPEPKKETDAEEGAGKSKNNPAPSEDSKESPHGEDVTSDFPNAKVLHLTVYYSEDKDKYTVVDNEDDGFVVKRTKSVTNLNKFLKKQISN